MDRDDAIFEVPAFTVLEKISTQQVHNLADQQKQSEIAFKKTKEREDDPISDSNSEYQEITLLDKNQTIETGEKRAKKQQWRTLENKPPASIFIFAAQKTNTMNEDDGILEAPASIVLEKTSTPQVHNQADQQKRSEVAFEKTQEREDDPISDSNSEDQEIALLHKNQITEAEEKEGE
ncbi:Hypothetical predicted protein [Olea europaea subsp. europaea]|uniref:Uncharacterized protein n=1 Tax=Olea europaea subsp. europaea TaxID=158383 RepID=A0A8S0UJA0_OLEEU|nr:Hypothetical predicted protein [Olea europaea subsp. europaea]